MKNLLILLSFFILLSCGSTNGIVSGSNRSDSQGTTHGNSNHDHTTTTDTSASATVYYGFNGLTKFNSVSVDDSGFRTVFASIGLDYFRYPGGTNANYAQWRTDSPSLKSLQILKKAIPNINFVFDLNILTSTLSEQLAMLDSANKLGLISDKTIVEYGNELNLFDYEGKSTFPTGKAYADTAHRWIAEVKKKFPVVKHACVGEDKKWRGGQNWNADVLAVNPDVQLIWHFYPGRTAKYTLNGYVDTVKLKYYIHLAYNDAFKGIPASKVWITEFNIGDHDNDLPQYLDSFTNDQIKVAVKFCLQEFTDMGITVILKHNVVSGKSDSYPALFADKHESHLLPAGLGFQEFLQNRRK